MAGSKAVGLIQFMPSTAIALGTTSAALAEMTQIAQLDYVQAYFKPYYTKIKTLSDMYLAILMPKYVSSHENTIIFKAPTIAYKQNSGFDTNKDYTITKKEVSQAVIRKYVKGMNDDNRLDIE
jgi:hypothetical protein